MPMNGLSASGRPPGSKGAWGIGFSGLYFPPYSSVNSPVSALGSGASALLKVALRYCFRHLLTFWRKVLALHRLFLFQTHEFFSVRRVSSGGFRLYRGLGRGIGVCLFREVVRMRCRRRFLCFVVRTGRP